MHDHEGRPISGGFTRRRALELGAAAAVGTAVTALGGGAASADDDDEKSKGFKVDPSWPKPLPDKWIMAEVAGNAVDSKDHIWGLTRSRATPDNFTEKERRMVREGRAQRSPTVIEFDKSGEVVNSWNLSGTPPDNMHGIFVDYQGYVWIGGNGGNDSIVQKYDRKGTLQRQIGVQHMRDLTNHSPTLLNRPSDIFVDPANGEVYISDGYGNRRVIVFGPGNADTTARRMWGEQGTVADAEAGAPFRFLEVVHAVNIGADGLVYVNDRKGDRIHVYTKAGAFVRNIWIQKGVGWRNDAAHIAAGDGAAIGTAWDATFSTDKHQTFIYNADGEQELNWTIRRGDDHPTSEFGRGGHQAGESTFLHTIAVDSNGDLYAAETVGGRRIQKFKATGEHK
jgi:sugar lactone lactonase YvrE